MIAAPQIIAPKAIYTQISEHVRELIISGKLAPETKLPTTEQLAAEWHTTPKTIQNALVPLVKEGLLTRVPKRGTFVRPREERLTCVGIYCDQDVFAKGGSEFVRAVHAQLKRLLEAADVQPNLWLDPRPAVQQAQPWPALVSAAQKRKIQALIVPQTDWPHIHWLSKLPLPIVYQSTANLPNTVCVDLQQFAELSLRDLAERGCRSVGMIAPICPDTPDPRAEPHGDFPFIEHFLHVAEELGIQVKNAWMRLTKRPDEMRGQSHQSYGYREFHHLWQAADRPEGLVVMDDVTAQGVMTAILQLGVPVPGKLKLVLQKNENIDLLCPLPASFVISSERQIATALITQVQKQFRGEACEPICIPFRLASPHQPLAAGVKTNQGEKKGKET